MKHKDLAKKAGFHIASSNHDDIGWVWCSDGYPIDEELERFAELVRTKERDAIAKMCDESTNLDWFAKEIRARGEK
jgi:hypothetical protein